MRLKFLFNGTPAAEAVARKLAPLLVALAGLTTVIFVCLRLIPPWRVALQAWPVYPVAIGLCLGAYLLACARLQRRLERSGYRTCLGCWRHLGGATRIGNCGGCGRPFDIDNVRAQFDRGLTGAAGVPGPIRRLRVYNMLAIPPGGTAILAGTFGLQLPAFEWTILILGAVALAIVTTTHVLERRLMARVKESGFRACPACAYSLEGAASTGQCPECGRLFNGAELEHDWTGELRWWKPEH
jgi:hypothetical protein